jgi:hypothetical protein
MPCADIATLDPKPSWVVAPRAVSFDFSGRRELEDVDRARPVVLRHGRRGDDVVVITHGVRMAELEQPRLGRQNALLQHPFAEFPAGYQQSVASADDREAVAKRNRVYEVAGGAGARQLTRPAPEPGRALIGWDGAAKGAGGRPDQSSVVAYGNDGAKVRPLVTERE